MVTRTDQSHPRVSGGARWVCTAWLTLGLLGCGTIGRSSPEPAAVTIVGVEAWGGTRSAVSTVTPSTGHKLTHITLHHGGVAFKREQDPLQYLRNLQNWSRKTRMWSDIPYHYLIDLDGRIYEGRDLRVPGDTNTNYDPTGHALIMVMGNYEEVEPNPAQLSAVVSLMTEIARKHNLPTERIGGHRDYTNQTVCPGKHLLPYLQNGYFRDEVGKRLRGD